MRSTCLLGFAVAGALLCGRPAAAVEIDAPQLFRQLDANADGRLTRDEVGAEHARLFARLVRTCDDGDGLLTAEEFAAGLTPVRADKQDVQKQGSRLAGSDALIVLLAKMDANGDRKLVAGEIPAQFRDTFQAMLARGDADKNGQLETREIAEAAPALSGIGGGAAIRLRIDVPGELAKIPAATREALAGINAFPDPREMLADPKQAGELFARFDADGDNFLTAEEAPPGLARFIERGDRDGDGKLSEAELAAIARRMSAGIGGTGSAPTAGAGGGRRNLRQLLSRLDRDGDGALSRQEAPPRMAQAFDRLDANGDGKLSARELQRFSAPGRPQPQHGAAGQDSAEMDEEMQ